MECPHLQDCVKLIEPVCTTHNSKWLWSCSVCHTEKSPWLCLYCGEVNCGRYIEAHARDHHATIPTHCLCMECESTAIFCYQCDEFVINDTPTGQLALIRQRVNNITINHAEGEDENCVSPSKVQCESKPQENHTDTIELEKFQHVNQVEEICLFQKQSYKDEINEETIVTDINDEDMENKEIKCTENGPRNLQEIRTSPPKGNMAKCDSNQFSANMTKVNEHWGNCSLKASCELKENCRQSLEKPIRRKIDSPDCSLKKKVKLENGPKVKPKTAGLRNLGNTCFMNAVLQSLSNIQSFCGYIKDLPPLETKVISKKIHQTRQCKDFDDVFVVEELRKTLVSLWQGGKGAISPEALFSVIWKVVPRFRGYQQQDAHEFMRYLLDRLHVELLTLLPYAQLQLPFLGPKGKSTIVTAIFGGILQNEVNCLICSIESKKHDPFLDLSLDIPTRFTAKSAVPKEGETVCHISDCLHSFTEVEELEESELYYCYNCKQKQRSTKRFWIRRLPNVLCLHLKRFRWNTYFRCKVDTFVDFPLRGLDMNGFMLDNLHGTRNSCTGNNEYDLAAVIVHHGSGAGSGHYTSYAMNDGQWYHFNDSTVSACSEETVSKCKAYILFYVRHELKLPGSNNLRKS